MENGSFHTSPPSILEADDLVKNVPLPFEMPKGMDFTRAPSERPGASTIETLIGQNEDLMARLGVSLRRTTQLEERLEHLEKENLHLKHRFETIKDSLLVLQQKDQMVSQRNQSLMTEGTELKTQLKKLEQRYTDLYVQAQTMQESVMRLERYRSRIKKAAKNVQARAKQAGKLSAMNLELATQQAAQVQAFEAKLHECKVAMDAMTERLTDRDQLYDAKVKIENKLIFTERQHENYRQDVEARLLRQEQAIREQIKDEQQQVYTELQALRDRTQVEMDLKKLELEEKVRETHEDLEVERRLILSQLDDEKIQLQNAIAIEREVLNSEIELERQAFYAEQESIRQQVGVLAEKLDAENQSKNELSAKILRLTEELDALRNQTRIHITELNTLSESEAKAQNQIELLKIQERNLLEQVDALQILWQDKQRTMEKLEDKNNSLQKLNQQLSLNLNQSRKELHLIKNEMEFERQQHQEQMMALREEIKLLK